MRYAPPGLCINDFALLEVQDGYLGGSLEPVTLRSRDQRLALVNVAGGRHDRQLPRPARRLRVLTVGEYIEVYADDVYVLSANSYTGQRSVVRSLQPGLSSNIRVRHLGLPDPGRDDASAVWRGPEH